MKSNDKRQDSEKSKDMKNNYYDRENDPSGQKVKIFDQFIMKINFAQE